MVLFETMPTYLDQSLAKLEQFEGSIPWMYLDTAGKVTVGVGLMLPNAAAAQRLAFTFAERSANPAEIAADFARVHAMPMGRPAQFYHSAAAPQLPQAEIDSLLRTVLIGFEGELRARLPLYDSFPDGVKLALLDMIYNLGPAGLFQGYPRLMQAVDDQNWSAAAAASFRHGPGAARNQWTQQMFLSGVAPTNSVAGPAGEGRLKRIGYGLLGMSAAAVHRLRRKP